ncbi:MAG: lytic transglycosylase domain-containing protein [Gammaproteobacteria bacterium]|nr:lytic transglycosylase domain-containing protein [Gammaproteobacteria bacterium]
MKRPRLIAAGLLYLVNWYNKRQATEQPETAPEQNTRPEPEQLDQAAGDLVDDILWDMPIEDAIVTTWTPPRSADPYLATIHATEEREGIPRDLLTRLLYQESRFRPDIITGQVKSSAGAEGIAQIVPRWHPGVDPLDPDQAIPYAGNYLAELHDQFGSWSMALAAYNWGPGNLRRQGFQHAPAETRAYVAQIMGDMGNFEGDIYV